MFRKILLLKDPCQSKAQKSYVKEKHSIRREFESLAVQEKKLLT